MDDLSVIRGPYIQNFTHIGMKTNPKNSQIYEYGAAELLDEELL